ncbi:hypothetical protein FE391_23355 [Nonomuraea sp. KC401]|uniref:hypothetical protein n=1 Tax=unclassified Nonomuraea TaxID=2593643 RepID=UPI0010FF561E|nr:MULTISPECIES: hypothetical protein [unclassified Nonomuraea]NBE96371.1 hypothetical protein [Nonomuraea sp. K271]TLF68087.1 hypothetical protein FE391_23355 [Nonomuraea sp. KC401]
MPDIGFHATAEDLRIIRAALREGERPSDVIRRALRLLRREMWHDRVRAAARRSTEDLSGEH